MKKKVLLTIIILLVISIISYLIYNKLNNSNDDNNLFLPNKITIKDIEKHYNEIVKVNKDTDLLDKNNKIVGKIKKDTLISLEKQTIKDNTRIFPIKDSDLFIKYDMVDKSNEIIFKNERYKNYIPYNENIITNDITNFYDEKENLIYTINNSFTFPIIIKEKDYYGIEYNNNLYYIKKDDIKETTKVTNSTSTKATKILTLAYHYIYDPETRKCTQVICNSKKQFETHLKYLKDSNFFSLQLYELEMFFDGKINLPKNSIAITIDDGYIDDITYELLAKYEMYATLFVITGRFTDFSQFESPYLKLESHTDNMHNSGECRGYGLQGGGILCKSDEDILKDLRTSQEKINGSKYFAYPFYDWNNRAINLLKEAGFTMAFVGQASTNGYAKQNVNKFKVPRKTILSTTTNQKFYNLFVD